MNCAAGMLSKGACRTLRKEIADMADFEEFKRRYRAERQKQKAIFGVRFFCFFAVLVAAAVILCTVLHLSPVACAAIGGATGGMFAAFWKALHEEQE